MMCFKEFRIVFSRFLSGLPARQAVRFRNTHDITRNVHLSCRNIRSSHAGIFLCSERYGKVSFTRNYSSPNLASPAPLPPSLENSLAALKTEVSLSHRLPASTLESFLRQVPIADTLPEGLCAYLLSCCLEYTPTLAPKQRVDLADKIWTAFKTRNYKFNKSDTEQMMELYAVNQQPWSVKDSVVDLNDQGSLLGLLRCSAEVGDLASAAMILSQMRQRGFSIGEEVFACLILGHGRAREYSSIQSVLNTMRDTFVALGTSSYVALLQTQIENNIPIKNTIADVRASGIVFSIRDILKLISSIAAVGQEKLLRPVLSLAVVEDERIKLRNCAIQLIHSGHHVLALKVMQECPLAFVQLETPNSFGSFFPRELVAVNMNSKEIVSTCDNLQRVFPSHNNFLLLATEASLRDQTKTKMSSELLGYVKPLRSHYFWPLTVRTKDLNSMAVILNRMQELGVRVDNDTLAFYTFPNLITREDPVEALLWLQKSCNLSVASLLTPLIQALLAANLFSEAIRLCKKFARRVLDLSRLSRPLCSATVATQNLESSASLLGLIARSRHITEKPVDFVDSFLIDFSGKSSPEDFLQMLKLIKKERLAISSSCYDFLTSKLRMNAESIALLDSLADMSRDVPSPLNTLPHPRDMSLEELEGHLVELKSKDLNTRGVLRRLLQLYCRFRLVDKALEVKQELEEGGYMLSPGILASMFSLHVQLGDVEGASKVLDELNSHHPSFRLDAFKMIDFCVEKIKHGASLEEVVSTLKHFESLSHQHGHGIRPSGMSRNCALLLDTTQKQLGDDAKEQLCCYLTAMKFLEK